jgi:hypothetical protein
MSHITKPSNPVNFDSGQRRDLEEIIKNIRKDIIIHKNKEKGAPAEAESERADRAGAKRGRSLLGRAGTIRMGLVGMATRIPA